MQIKTVSFAWFRVFFFRSWQFLSYWKRIPNIICIYIVTSLRFIHKSEVKFVFFLLNKARLYEGVWWSVGAWGSVVVKALRYYSEGPRVDPRSCHWGFFSEASDKSMCPGSTQPFEMSTRIFLGVKMALMCPLSRNPGALTSRTPQGHVGLFGGYFLWLV
jgi:hypothetical protein